MSNKHRKIFSVFTALVCMLLCLLYGTIFVTAADKKGYTVRYEGPYAITDTNPLFLGALLQGMQISVEDGKEFAYQNQKTGEDTQLGTLQGSVSMTGKRVTLPGTATPVTALYGVMTFSIAYDRTVDGEHTYIDFNTNSVRERVVYTYDGPFFVVVTSGSTGKEVTTGYDPFTRKSVDMQKETFFYNKENAQTYYNRSAEFPPSGIIMHVTGTALPPPITNKTIETEAGKQAGETESAVPAAIAIGVAAAAAAAVGIGAAGASGGKATDDAQAATYKLIVGKNFGDAVKFGKKHTVWARIVEQKDYIAIDRPDLTQSIDIFSDSMLVGAVQMQGINIMAEVQIQEQTPHEGILSFRFNGPEGYFQNNVRFRLLGKGQLRLAADKVSILSTEAAPYQLVYQLINFVEEEPPLEITASSGLVKLDLGKNDRGQTVILITPGSDAQQWDRSSFTKACRCEISALDGQLPIKASFEVTVCFEGIGTAFEGLSLAEMPVDALIECFTEAEKNRRQEKALWIPLTVMTWNEKGRLLEPDNTKADTLKLSFAVHPEFAFKSADSKALAERVLGKAKLEARMQSAPAGLKMDAAKKPSAYRLMASEDPGEGAAEFDIAVTVTCESDAALLPASLKVALKPNPDFRGMVRWFLEYPNGSAAADFITLGNVDTYHGALDFIENRVYPRSGVPWSASLLWVKDSNSHYETGRGDIMRKSYVAIQDDHFPKGIGAAEFEKVQTLVHELTHVIEDQHGDYAVTAISERHAYYLQYLSDLASNLADLEGGQYPVMTLVRGAIKGAYRLYTDKDIIGDLGNIGPWFGGKFAVSVHELFDRYAYHIDTLGGNLGQVDTQVISERFKRDYFPGNLCKNARQKTRDYAYGYYIETDGPFKDAEWLFDWDNAVLNMVSLSHDSFVFEVEDWRWAGGSELKLMLKIILRDKVMQSQLDYLAVTLDGGTFRLASNEFPEVRSFTAIWKTLNDGHHSWLYTNTGLMQQSAWVKHKA